MRQFIVNAFTNKPFEGNPAARGGQLMCTVEEQRVRIAGEAKLFAISEIMIEETNP